MEVKYETTITAVGKLAHEFLDNNSSVIILNEGVHPNLSDMVENRDKYKYNLLGLFLAAFNIHKTFDNRFYCSEFVKYIFEKSDIDVSILPDIPHPTDFMKFDNDILYEGLLHDYSKCYRR